MRYTQGPIPCYARREQALQIFSIKVRKLKDGLDCPLHVYGFVSARDDVDLNRNLLFNRTRDNCQILTQQDPYLLLTGPSRAIVLIDPVFFEVHLNVKGKTKAEDKVLSMRVWSHRIGCSYIEQSSMIRRSWSCKRSKLELACADLLGTVEATVVTAQVTEGSWPDHLRGQVVCRTASVGEGDIMLLDSKCGRMPINGDGIFELPMQGVLFLWN